jgi:3-(3-hydroxy-phenyl)propionate hydroxylase
MRNVEVWLGTEVTGVANGADRALLTCVGYAGEVTELDAAWVVGCDGAWSLVRESVGIALDDLGFEESWLVIDLLLPTGSDPLRRSAVCRCDPDRPTYSIPMPADRHRFEFMLVAGEKPADMLKGEKILALVAPWLDTDGVRIERSAVYAFHGLVAREWRKERVLLAGDAAHQMPPFLGQGMCSGIRDAANLAWKLSRVLHNGVRDSLLDSYGRERGVHVRSIIEAAVAYGRVICTVDRHEAAERDRRMLSDAVPVTQRMPFTLPPLPSGELVLKGGGDLFVQPRRDAGPRLDDLIGPNFAVIGRTANHLGQSGMWWNNEMGAFVKTVAELGEYSDTVQRWLTAHAADAVVVRPDRYVLWAGKDLDNATMQVAPLLSGRGAGALETGHAEPGESYEPMGGARC